MLSNGIVYVLNWPLSNVKLIPLNKEFRFKHFFPPVAFFIAEAISIKSKTLRHTILGISVVTRFPIGMQVLFSE